MWITPRNASGPPRKVVSGRLVTAKLVADQVRNGRETSFRDRSSGTRRSRYGQLVRPGLSQIFAIVVSRSRFRTPANRRILPPIMIMSAAPKRSCGRLRRLLSQQIPSLLGPFETLQDTLPGFLALILVFSCAPSNATPGQSRSLQAREGIGCTQQGAQINCQNGIAQVTGGS